MYKYAYLISSYLLLCILSVVILKIDFTQTLKMLLQIHKKLYRMKNSCTYFMQTVENFLELKVRI